MLAIGRTPDDIQCYDDDDALLGWLEESIHRIGETDGVIFHARDAHYREDEVRREGVPQTPDFLSKNESDGQEHSTERPFLSREENSTHGEVPPRLPHTCSCEQFLPAALVGSATNNDDVANVAMPAFTRYRESDKVDSANSDRPGDSAQKLRMEQTGWFRIAPYCPRPLLELML